MLQNVLRKKFTEQIKWLPVYLLVRALKGLCYNCNRAHMLNETFCWHFFD